MLNFIVSNRILNRLKSSPKININMWETKDFIHKKLNKKYINYYKTLEFKNYKPNLKK